MFSSPPIDLTNFKNKTFNPDDATHVDFVNNQMAAFQSIRNKLLGLDKLVLAMGGGANTLLWAVGIFGFYGILVHPAIYFGMAHYYFNMSDIRKEFAKEFHQQRNMMKDVASWCGDKSELGKRANELIVPFNTPAPESWNAILFATKKQIEARLYNTPIAVASIKPAEPVVSVMPAVGHSLLQTVRQMFG
jgi:hypothetical protein